MSTILLNSELIGAQDVSINPIPQRQASSLVIESIGKKLFNDARLSKEHSHTCASCHQLPLFGTDQEETYVGFHNVAGAINTPTILNATYNFRQFWDGRAESFSEVIDDHIFDKTIFNNDWNTIIKRLNDNPDYMKLFSEAFTDGITESNIELSIKTYLNELTTPNAPFDLFIAGKTTAISEDAKKGFELFKQFGCISCHQGRNIGGNLFQKMGIYKNYFEEKQFISQSDLGRYNVTGNEGDKFVFKVPSLRNVTHTAPYLHDGTAKNLKDAITIMAEYQVGQPIAAQEVTYIIEFLKTLTGELPNED